MFDFHSHVLPNMDDGSTSIQESLDILNMLDKQGVDTLCFTSHYYPKEEEINEYITRRNIAFDNIVKEYKGKIKLFKGSEVLYYRGISMSNDIFDLCIEGSDFLLLELPYRTKIDFRELYTLNNKLTVVLAHIERYLDLYNFNELTEITSNGILLQSNTEMFNSNSFKHIKKLFDNEMISFIGSDAHDINNRRPKFDDFQNYILENYGQIYYDKYIEKMNNIFWGRMK